MASLNTITLSDMTKLADVIWLENLESLDATAARRSGLFKEDPIPNHTGDTKEYSEIDIDEYAKNVDEGDQASNAKVQQGYSKTLTIVERGYDAEITKRMRMLNKYPQVIARLTSLSKTTVNRLDLDLTHRLTFGTSTSYTDMDGRSVDVSTGDSLALFYSAHTLKGTSSTYRNRLSGDPQFSKGALEAIEKLATEQTLNQFGEKMTCNFDIVWSGDDPNTVNTIRETLQSTAETAAPNAGVVNVYKAKYRHVIFPRLATTATGTTDTTKVKWWGIASSSASSAYLAMVQEPTMNAPAIASNAEEVSSKTWTYTARIMYGICIVSASWIKASCPTTT